MAGIPRSYRICPSIIAGDFMSMGEAMDELALSGCEHVHLDIMDGHFVPQITFGAKVVHDVCTRFPGFTDCHLMVTDPESQAAACAEAGADLITVHAECFEEWGGDQGSLKAMLAQIADLGVLAAVAVDGPTVDLSPLESVLSSIDMVLIATGKVGKAGQNLDAACLAKVQSIRAFEGGSDIDIMVDIGINLQTLEQAVKSGANWFAASSAVFQHPEGPGAGFQSMNQLLLSFI